MRFLAVDVETANPSMSSICQIGVVAFENGEEVDAKSYLIDPNDYFYDNNIRVHGITEEVVHSAPSFTDIYDDIRQRSENQIVACHTHFDRVAISQACGKHNVAPFSCQWLDTAKVARRTWSEFSQSGYGLSNLAKHFGIEFQHHDALHDARTAGLILLRAIQESGITAEEWITHSNKSVSSSSGQPLRRNGSAEGPLVGERVVFTGAFDVSKSDAADKASSAGAAVDPELTKKTTLLVVGGSSVGNFDGHEKSGKHRKAEKLMEAGHPIRIMSESDFLIVCNA